MPITKGAEKAHRQSEKKRIYNVRRKSVMSDVVKTVNKAVASGDAKTAKELLPKAYKAIDKAAKRGIIKKNTASRKKSRLTIRVKGIKA
jgi:small subunit ribosomal protein S20